MQERHNCCNIKTPLAWFIALYQKVGCFRDPGNITSLENKDPVLDICFKARTNAVKKCAVAAAKRNFRVFAVKNGGECLSDSTAESDYNNTGSSDACKDDGEGGPKANEVYIFQGMFTTYNWFNTGSAALSKQNFAFFLNRFTPLSRFLRYFLSR